MSRYIEFSTAPDKHLPDFFHGNPLHNRKVPGRRVDSPIVRVNGEPITFDDESIPDRLLRTLRVKALMNCYSFTLNMFSVIPLEEQQALHDPPSVDWERPVTPEDFTIDPIIIGEVDDCPFLDIIKVKHMLTPAHYNGQPRYLHKLGYDGQICISGLAIAQQLYASNGAFAMVQKPSITSTSV